MAGAGGPEREPARAACGAGPVATAAPEPSYEEESPWSVRVPGRDVDVGFYFSTWRESPPREDDGGLVERDLLTAGDPQAPARRGGVLTLLTSFRRATLRPASETRSFRLDRSQAFVYVAGGSGRIEAGGKSASLSEGTAVVLPAGLPFRFANPGAAELELYIAKEDVPPGFRPNRAASVGSFRGSRPIVGAHWAHIARPFAYDVEPRFAHAMGFVVVSMDARDIAQPHTHGPGTEEIWLQLKGRSLLLLGNVLLRQAPGEAFLVPPNRRAPHASINPGDGPVQWLYFGGRT